MSRGPEQLTEIPKEVIHTARDLTRYTDLSVGISEDYSLTIGNVTFNRYFAIDGPRTAAGLADLVDYYSDENAEAEGWQPGHMMFTAAPSTEPGREDWEDQSSGPIERPNDFIRIVEPPSKLARRIRHVLYGF